MHIISYNLPFVQIPCDGNDSCSVDPSIRKSNQDLYNDAVDKIDLSSLLSPACLQPGGMERSTSYLRKYSDYDRDCALVIHGCLVLVVFFCRHCGTYHAVIPSFLCPYSSFSYAFMEAVYDEFHSFGLIRGVYSYLSRTFSISVQSVHSILDQMEEGLRPENLPQICLCGQEASPISASSQSEEEYRPSEDEGTAFSSRDLPLELIALHCCLTAGIPLFFPCMIHTDHSLSYIEETFKNRPDKPKGGNYCRILRFNASENNSIHKRY